MCQPKMAPRGIAGCTRDCCGCGSGLAFRRFFSSQELRECLEDYRDQLKKELAGVEDHIKKSKK
jgi:hypothetical protein